MVNKSLKNVEDNYRIITKTYKNINIYCNEKMPTMCEWLADNYYMLDQIIKEIMLKFDSKLIKQLNINNELRLYNILYDLFSSTDKVKSEKDIINYLNKTQKNNALSSKEIWCAYDISYLVIIELIKEICLKINRYLEKKENLLNSEIAVLSDRMGMYISQIRKIQGFNVKKLFDNVSEVERVLLKDPAGYYKDMEISTKDHYRHAVEIIAKKNNLSELQVVEAALKLSLEAEDIRKRHIGYYLLNEPLGKKDSKSKNKAFYASGNIISYIFIQALFIYLLYLGMGLKPMFYILCILSAIPLSDISINLVNYLMSKMFKPSMIPKLDLDDIDKNAKTAVVIPALVVNKNNIDDLIRKIEIYYVTNILKNVYFGLLVDLKESKNEVNKEDKELTEYLLNKIEEINNKYESRPFYALVRKRIYLKSQDIYMGWERKRGALIEFINLIKGNKTGIKYLMGSVNELSGTKYIITLDVDTHLGIGNVKRLVGAMEHPLNIPRIDHNKNRVVEGYGVIQPRVSTSLKSAYRSIFSKIFVGIGGFDPYSSAFSDIYQDNFSEGIFTGKGIFNVDIFYNLVDPLIKENTVLSHDLLEGLIARAALVTDIEFTDGFPSKVISYFERYHRWVRGDWQLIKWLFPFIYNKAGEKTKNPLSALSKWKIIDNLRRSLIAPFLLATLIISIFYNNNISLILLGSIVLVYLFGFLTSVCDNIIYRDFKHLNEKNYNRVIYGTKSVVLRFLTMFILIPYNAYISMDAILRTLYRILFSKQKMLEWTTSQEAEGQTKNSLIYFYCKMWSSVVTSAYLFLFAYDRVSYIILGIVFALSPLIAYKISLDLKSEKFEADIKDILFLRELLTKMWRFFSMIVTKTDNYLPPDNYQVNPYNGIAHRTSPTNIGLYLLCVLGAYDAGLIKKEEMFERINKTLSTVEILEKHKGHLYNWYNTKDLQILDPKFISTVDSGNFIACLITLKEGLKEFKNDQADKLIERIERIVDDTEFIFLYNKDKHLFSIGYNKDEDELSESCYDLLASEARQTSYIAIARGEIDKRHWNTLGRSVTKYKNHYGLVSWTGTMFEYLMPLILIPNVKGSILDETYQFIVDGQIDYAKSLNYAWGVSESGFYSFDINLNYQYKAFGIPRQGLKRGLDKEYVISPYSTMLALMVRPKEAIKNLKKLSKMNLYSEYGFYEAADFTKERQTSAGDYEIVESYMVHHQAMGFLSIINLLQNNIFQKRFLKDIKMEAAKELLEEKITVKIVLSKNPVEKAVPKRPVERINSECVRIINPNETYPPKSHVLSNGKMTLFIDACGNNYFKFDEIYLNRYRNNYYFKNYGNFLYIKDRKSGKFAQLTYSPTDNDIKDVKFIFSNDKAEIRTQFENLDCLLSIGLGLKYDVLVYQLSITNKSDEERELDISSFCEIILSDIEGDIVHPAFNSLFIRTDYFEDKNLLLASKRPRGETKKEINAVHFVIGDNIKDISYDTSRLKLLGRKNQRWYPNNIKDSLSNTKGAVLDPVFSLNSKVSVLPNKSIKLYFVTAFLDDKNKIDEVYFNYDTPEKINSNLSELRKRAWAELNYINADEIEQELYFDILSNLVYKTRRDDAVCCSASVECLWCKGISGDLPIVLCELNDNDNYCIAGQLVKAHEFLRIKGIEFDLVFLVHDEDNYSSPNLKQINEEIIKTNLSPNMNVKGGVYVLAMGSITDNEYKTLNLFASITLSSSQGSIRQQISKYFVANKSFSKFENGIERPKKLEDEELYFFNGYGGFNKNNEYVINISKNNIPPLPWVNVLANPRFGTITSDTGGGYTFSENSRENKLTHWSNDTINDRISEAIYIKDNDYISTITPYPIITDKEYRVVYGFGYTKYITDTNDLYKELLIYVPVNDPVKASIVKLKNNSDHKKTISLYYYVKPILDVTDKRANKIYVSKNENMLLFENKLNHEFNGRIAFVSSTENILAFESDIFNFPGNNSMEFPYPVVNDVFSNKTGIGFEVCGLIKTEIEINPNEEKQVGFIFGQAFDLNELEYIKGNYNDLDFLLSEYKRTYDYWQNICGKIKVKTKDLAFNKLINGWLVYQILSCRVYARCAFYQAGGAFGFRDQLQDCMALVNILPQLTRNQILKHSCHQFKEGDVQHWWHTKLNNNEMLDKGVRTRFSDDFLWLCYVTSEYIRNTKDTGILDEEMPFIDDPPLKDNEQEKYITPKSKTKKEPLYMHLIKAVERGSNFGERGLPKIGCGDWNDGFSEVGKEGKGESVWLGWFLYDVLLRMSELCDIKNDNESSGKYKETAEILKKNLNNTGWDKQWYLRAYFDNGEKIGSSESEECKIDSIAQAWSVISKAGDKEKQEKALKSVLEYLVDEEVNIIKLLDPPFDKIKNNPGYIKSYVPGVRENGGQYTHGAVWVSLAFLLFGDNDTGYKLYSMINPINHSLSKEDADLYMTEPYAIAADIYAQEQNKGRGGWSWYTGAAGWYYKVGIEYILGLKREGNYLKIEPKIPSDWDGFEVSYLGHEIKVQRVKEELEVTFDGKKSEDNRFII